MDPRKLKRLSHAMSAVLRHRAGELGMPMDAAGWVALDVLARHLRASRAQIMEVVADNNKTRYQVEDDRIRASQGHSLDGMPVTQDALEASWTRFLSEQSIWHGTRTDAVDSIARGGILRSRRTHVHLAASTASKVGKRSQVGVILEVSPAALRAAGYDIFRSPNGVILTRHVPPECIVGMVAISKRSKSRAPAMRVALGLSP